ncbi:MAG: hypothetical protein LBE56_08990 [Tannerella sp.]|nr:hypothetical protein [Tannerella sp.]
MIQKFINKYFFYLYVFTLFFGVLLYNTTGFKGLDIASSVILVVFYGIYLIGAKKRKFNIAFLFVVTIFLFYLNYSFYISYNTRNAIAMDFMTQLRPYLTFFMILQMSPTLSDKQKSILKKIVFYTWLLFIPVGLYALINSSFLSTLMDKPSNYTACIVALSIVFLYCSNFSIKDKLTFVFMMSMGLITVHTQFYIFFLIVCGLIMFFHHAAVLKSNWKTGIALATIACLIIFVSRSEITSHLFPAGLTGGGFASLATSSGFSSQLNEGINPLSSFISQEWFSSSVSYYPVLAQLGLIGILLYMSFWGYIIVTAIMQFKQKGDIQPFIIVLMLVVFIFLENLSDSFFTSNKGYFMMMFIGLLLSKPEEVDRMMIDESFAKKNRKSRESRMIPIINIPGKKLLFWQKKDSRNRKTSFAKLNSQEAKQERVVKQNNTVSEAKISTSQKETKLRKKNQVSKEIDHEKSVLHTVSTPVDEVKVELIEDTVKEPAPPVQTVETVQPVAEIHVSVPPAEAILEDEEVDEWDDTFEDEDEWDDYLEEEDEDLDEDDLDEGDYEEVAEKEIVTPVAETKEIFAQPKEVIEEVTTPDEIVQEYTAPEEIVHEFTAPKEIVQEVTTPEKVVNEVTTPVESVQEQVESVQSVAQPKEEYVQAIAAPVEAAKEVATPAKSPTEVLMPVTEVSPVIKVTPIIEVTPVIKVNPEISANQIDTPVAKTSSNKVVAPEAPSAKEVVTPVEATRENTYVSPFRASIDDEDEMIFVSPIEYIEAENEFAMPSGDSYDMINKFISPSDEIFEFSSPVEAQGNKDTTIFSDPQQYTEPVNTKPTDAASTESKPNEDKTIKAKPDTGEDIDDDFSEDMFTYMI